MRSLQAIGYTPEMANAAWGNYSSMVLPLFHMPQVLLTPIAYATLPALRSHVARGDVREAEQLMKSALTVTAIVSALAALGLSLFSYDALQLLYTDQDAVARAYPKLALVSLAIFPLGLVTTASTLLQAFGKLWTPTVAFAIGACVKIFVTLALTEMLGESVSPWGTLLSYTVTAALDLALLSQKLPLALSAVTLKPFFVAGVSVLGAVFVRAVLTQASLSARLVSVLSIGVAALLALGLAVLTRAIKEEDLLVFGIAVKPRRKKQ
ncbi:MAG: polysaccharide biosynthesis C-terminal domain-containing protein [Clostridia bacterium]|nr:polysaccharide biosynthesis C-terminal domain-containing protein [Clostridia bacterium]